MRRETMLLLPLVALLGLVGCEKKPSSTGPKVSSTTSTPSSVTTPSSTSSPTTSVDLSVSFLEAVAGQELTIKTDWAFSYVDVYDKAIKLKTESDFVETPLFDATGKLEVSFKAYKTCGALHDGKLVLAVEGLSKDGAVVEEKTIKDSEIPEGADKADTLKVELANTKGDIRKVRIGIKEPGRATNVAIEKIDIKSVK